MKKIFLIVFICSYLFSNERIVNLSPAINEIVYALGMGDKIVGNTVYSDFPEQSKSVKKVGGYASISLEKVLELNPSVVIAQDYEPQLMANIKALGFKILTYKTARISDIKFCIEDLGKVFKKEQKSKEILNQIDEGLKNLAFIVQNRKILIVISPKNTLSNEIYVTGNFVYFEDIIKASGNQNAYVSQNQAQPVLNTEKIIKLNPDIVILLAPYFANSQNELNQIKEVWKTLPINASKYDTIYAVDKDYAGIPSHRIAYFIEDFRKILEDVRNKKLQ